MKVAVCIPSLYSRHRINFFSRCRDSALASVNHEIRVFGTFDNYPDEDVPGDCTPVRVSEYKCVAGARHLASLAALETWDPDYLLQMDDDAWVDPTCIDELVRVLQTYPMIGLAMAAGVSVWDHALEHDLERVSTGAVCMMLSAKTYQDIQGYDPKTHCVDDRDLSIRVFLLGKEVVKVKNAKAHHVPHRTTKENGVLVNDGLGPIESRNYPFYIDYIVKKYASVGIEVKVTSNGRLRYVDGLVRRGVLPKSFKYNYADLDEAILAGSLIYKPAF